MVNRMQAIIKINATSKSFFMPIISTSIPPMITAKGNPQNAVADIDAVCALFNPNSVSQVPSIPARMPNDSEVTNKARQLAIKS